MGRERLRLVSGAEDDVGDVTLVDARVIVEECEAAARRSSSEFGHKIDDEAAEDVARHPLRSRLLLLLAAFALADELLRRLRDVNVMVHEAREWEKSLQSPCDSSHGSLGRLRLQDDRGDSCRVCA